MTSEKVKSLSGQAHTQNGSAVDSEEERAEREFMESMDAMQEYVELQGKLQEQLKQGLMSLARAKYSMGGRPVGQDKYDPGMVATTRCMVSPGSGSGSGSGLGSGSSGPGPSGSAAGKDGQGRADSDASGGVARGGGGGADAGQGKADGGDGSAGSGAAATASGASAGSNTRAVVETCLQLATTAQRIRPVT
eukprot:XP_001696108.1 predicted protein [Chlamydomonas reinhardtii]